jgi:hypothetical protein
METKDQQVKHIVIGVALGVLAQGISAVTSNKMAFEFAFDHAWQNWSQAKGFPSVKGHEPGNLFWIGVAKSERRQGVCAAWRTGRWSEPYVSYQGWTVEECLDLHADERASAEDWVELGLLYVSGFKREEVRRDS